MEKQSGMPLRLYKTYLLLQIRIRGPDRLPAALADGHILCDPGSGIYRLIAKFQYHLFDVYLCHVSPFS